MDYKIDDQKLLMMNSKTNSRYSVSIFHNIMWSKYKAGVFSAIERLKDGYKLAVDFTQIAETDSDRIGLAVVDLSYHRYPFRLLFPGSYSAIPKRLLIATVFREVWVSPASLILLPGYHTIEYWFMLLAAKLRRKVVGVFCDSTVYDRPRSLLKGVFKRIFFSQCDVFFGYGERSHAYLKMYGAAPDRIYFRCQASALPHDYNALSIIERRLNGFAAQSLNRFLYVGRLSAEKGLDTLLCAFAVVLNGLPDSRLVLVGSGPFQDALHKMATELGIAANVDFAGSKDAASLSDEYLSASCFVLPSTSEPWGLVVNEALSYGCPVVVSHRCGCVPELVREGVTGFTFEAGNANELAAKMIAVVTEFSDAAVVAKRCLDVIGDFTPEAAANQILEGCVATLARCRSNV